MNQLPLWAQGLQFIATIAIALFAGLIGFFQWRTARHKLALDLFEKRFQVFLDVRKIYSELLQLGKLLDPGLPNEIIARGRFLFGDDVQNKLKEFHRICINLEITRGVEWARAKKEADQLFEELVFLFGEYMSLVEKPPASFLVSASRVRARLRHRIADQLTRAKSGLRIGRRG